MIPIKKRYFLFLFAIILMSVCAALLGPGLLSNYYHRQGNRFKGEKNYEAALVSYSRAIQVNPSNSILYTKRGFMYLQLLEARVALEDFNTAIELDPNLTEAYSGRGFANELLGNPDHALDDYSQAILLDPGNFLHYSNRARVYEALGNKEAAIADYTQVISLSADENLYTVSARERIRVLGGDPP